LNKQEKVTSLIAHIKTKKQRENVEETKPQVKKNRKDGDKVMVKMFRAHNNAEAVMATR